MGSPQDQEHGGVEWNVAGSTIPPHGHASMLLAASIERP